MRFVPPNSYITLVGTIKMAAIISRENVSSSPLLEDAITVIVLEDYDIHREAIREILEENDLGWSVFFAQDKDEVERLANKHNAAYYVLDINLGPEKNQEGMMTAEFIKKGEQNTFVAMFSGVPDLANFKKRASRIGVDYFEGKSGNIQQKVCLIALEMLRYQKYLITGILEAHTFLCKLEPLRVESLTNQLQNINKKLTKIEDLERKYNSDNTTSRSLSSEAVTNPPAIKKDKNIQAYEEKMKNKIWVEDYNGKYVAFADGHWLEDKDFVTNDEESLLRTLNKSPVYLNIPVFSVKVADNTKKTGKLSDKQIRKMPSSLQFKRIRKAN
jgi:DNA-binding NarL/FixJ family response regulator